MSLSRARRDVANIYLKIEMEFSGAGSGWTDVTRDVREGSIRGSRGIVGTRPRDRIARTGLLHFLLLNNEENSAGLDGFYSPDHANVRSGFASGIGVRVTAIVGADSWVEEDWVEVGWVESEETFALWTGTITRIEPESGKHRIPRLVKIEARDYIDQMARARIAASTVERGISENDAAQALIDLMTVQPIASSVSPGPDIYDIAFDLVREERSAPLTIAQQLALSSFSTWYMQGDGTLVVEPRNAKRAVFGSSLNVDLAITESDLINSDPLIVEDTRLEAINSVAGVMTPREIATATVIVYRMTEPLAFPTGTTIISGMFTDPNERGVRAAGISLVNPVSGTDFAFNSLFDGSGTDETANVTVTPAFSGNAVELTIVNSAGFTVFPVKADGTILLQARGISVSAKERLFLKSEDAASIAAIGEHAMTYEMPYQSDIATGRALVDWFKNTLSDEEKLVRQVTLFLDPENVDRAAEFAALGVSDIVTISETMTGLDGTQKHHVNAIDFEARRNGHIWFHLGLVPAHAGPFVEFSAEANARLLILGGETNQAKTIFTTGNVSSAADNKLLLLWLTYGRDTTTATPEPTSVTGLGLTWVKVGTIVVNSGSLHTQRNSLYRAMGTPSDGVLTITHPGQTARTSWLLMEFGVVDTSGADGAGAIVQFATAVADIDPTAALASFGGFENRPAAGAGGIATTVMTQEAGWTLGGRRTGTSPIIAAWHETEPDESATIISPGRVGNIAVELQRTNVDCENLSTAGSTTPGTVFVTASVDPQDNALVLVGVASKDSSGSDPPAPTLAGNGLTYVQVATVVYDAIGGVRSRLTLFRALGAAPSAGTITISFSASQDECSWSIVHAAKVDTSGTNGSGAIVQSSTGSDLDDATVLAALANFAADENRAFVVAAHEGALTMAEKSTWTQLGIRTSATSIISAHRYDVQDQDASVSTPGSSGAAGAIAVEIKPA